MVLSYCLRGKMHSSNNQAEAQMFSHYLVKNNHCKNLLSTVDENVFVLGIKDRYKSYATIDGSLPFLLHTTFINKWNPCPSTPCTSLSIIDNDWTHPPLQKQCRGWPTTLMIYKLFNLLCRCSVCTAFMHLYLGHHLHQAWYLVLLLQFNQMILYNVSEQFRFEIKSHHTMLVSRTPYTLWNLLRSPTHMLNKVWKLMKYYVRTLLSFDQD